MRYGVEIGGVDDLDGYGGATLFMAITLPLQDGSRKIGRDIINFKVHGGFDLQHFSMTKMRLIKRK